jgi:5,10-methylenetetrahydromethanopterin reductase
LLILLSGDRPRPAGWTDEAALRFRPPRVTPIYLGAMSAGMLRLAGEVADGVLPLLFPPEHYFAVRPHLDEGVRRRVPGLPPLDVAGCIWVSLAEDRTAARRSLAEKVAYYGHALSPMILERLGLAATDFAAIERAMMVERDVARAVSLVDDRMLRIGVVGEPADVIARLEPLVEAGLRHLSFGPPLGPDPLAAVALLGQTVLPHFAKRRD